MGSNTSRAINKDYINESNSLKWYHGLWGKRTWLLVLMPISLIIIWIVKGNPYIAEYIFARGIYKLISQGLSIITGIIPFSVMELQIIGFPILLILFFIRFIYRLFIKMYKKENGIGYHLTRGFVNLGGTLSVILFMYVLLAGVNYYRYPFAYYSGLEIKESSVNELYELNLKLAEEAKDLREQLTLKGTVDENGVLLVNQGDWQAVSDIAKESFEKLSKGYPVLDGKYSAPKPVFFSDFMSRMEITGIFWPFTAEANVNIAVSEYSIPATMGHELAHLRGFMREDEANYIAYLVCKESDSLEFKYSGTMLALSYASNQLYKQDPDLYHIVSEIYNEGMVLDLRAEYYYWRQFEDTVISTVSNTMNDNYLKVNNQNDGVKSYGRMVDLLLAEYRKNKELD